MVKRSNRRPERLNKRVKSIQENCVDRNRCDDREVILQKRTWTPAEDIWLINYVENNGARKWGKVASELNRTYKSCRLRWYNQLSPDIIHKPFTVEEDEIIISMFRKIGGKWSEIARVLKGRTDNQIKNQWNGRLKKIHEQMVPEQLAEREISNGSCTPQPISMPTLISTSAGSVDLVPAASPSGLLPCLSAGSINSCLPPAFVAPYPAPNQIDILASVGASPVPSYETSDDVYHGLFTDPCTFYPTQAQQCAPIGSFTSMMMREIGSVDEEPNCGSELVELGTYMFYPLQAQQCAPVGVTAMMMETVDEEPHCGSGLAEFSPSTFYPLQVQLSAPIGEFTAMMMEAIGSVDEEPHCGSGLAESSQS